MEAKMARKYRTFSVDFKLDTVMEGFRGEKSIAQICRERGIKDVLY
jgi:transposase-like protein